MKYKIIDVGLIDYQKARIMQKSLFHRVRRGSLDAAFVFCQHNPVITMGRSSDRKNILMPENELKRKRISVYPVERGGDVTYHGPGQLMLYPIVNLKLLKKDIHWYLRQLESFAIGALDELSVPAKQQPGLTGLWVEKQKIASIGVAISSWITYHGLAINVKKSDLENFSLIKPCGLDIKMTSLESVLDKQVSVTKVKETLIRRIKNGQSSFTRARRRN